MINSKITYKGSGVDTHKAGKLLLDFAAHLKTRPQNHLLLGGVGPFAAALPLSPLLTRLNDPVLVTCCDGVGTKVKLALDWNYVEGLGEDLVAMSVNDLLCMGATPTLFLDYYACNHLEDGLLDILKSIQRGCEMAGCTLAGGETAEMPGLYSGKDFDLAGFAIGLAERAHMPSPQKVRVGDRLIAIASNGLHSNGYSLIRRLVKELNLQPEALAPWGESWRDALLKPTLIYTAIVGEQFDKIHGLAHITGGGLFENLPRVLPRGVVAQVDSSQWKFTELFKWIQDHAHLSDREMLSTFNCGVGLIAICDPQNVESLLAHFQENQIRAFEVGEIREQKEEDGSETISWN